MRYKSYEIRQVSKHHFIAYDDGALIGHATNADAFMRLIYDVEKEKGYDKVISLEDFKRREDGLREVSDREVR